VKTTSPFIKILPNLVTGSRLFFALAFLILLYLANPHDLQKSDVSRLTWSFIMFVIAGITDILDGPLARHWEVTSAFGRSFDPFVDKILILGGFAMMAFKGQTLTGIAWWMVAVILGREAFVTVMRSLIEAQGKEFGATWAGKLKMFLQSFAIGVILIFLAYHQNKTWARVFRDVSIWLTVIFTALSALIYLPRMRQLKKGK